MCRGLDALMLRMIEPPAPHGFPDPGRPRDHSTTDS